MKEYFSVLRLSRQDLEMFTEKQRKRIPDHEMQRLADKLGDALMEYYWISLKILVEDCDIITKPS
jgi:hypothetical protein